MENKPGYKTTEFWLSTAATVVGVLMASGVLEAGSKADQAIGMLATLLAALGYTVVRGSTKTATIQADAVKSALPK